MPSAPLSFAHASACAAGSEVIVSSARSAASIQTILSLRSAAKDACCSAFDTERYASDRSVYLPTTAIFTTWVSESTSSASAIHSLRNPADVSCVSWRRASMFAVAPWWWRRSGTR